MNYELEITNSNYQLGITNYELATDFTKEHVSILIFHF